MSISLAVVDEVRRRYQQRYIPGQRLYLTSAEPERWASIIVNNNDPMRPVIEECHPTRRCSILQESDVRRRKSAHNQRLA
jgi:hypothetical protein